ncbi:MAG: hypothetical protein DMD36_09320 [Gemmatimonadetes bacterium]|nr:MAG: hypothetical protein DMD36_09320 [Gemmatimonadota bacterium]
MECPRCHYANAGGARFCGECGASLTRDVTCSSCGRANPAGLRQLRAKNGPGNGPAGVPGARPADGESAKPNQPE